MGIDFGKIFRLSFKYPANKSVYLTLFAVQLVFAIATWFIGGFFGGGIIGPDGALITENIIPFLLYLMPLAIVGWIVMIFLLAAYVDNASQYFRGKNKPISENFATSKKRFLPLLLLFIVLGLILLACFGGIILAVAAVSLLSSPEGLLLAAAGAIWLLAGAVVGTIVVFMVFLSPVICILENARPLESIKKSWRLVAKNKANTLIFLVLLMAVYFAVAVIGSVPEIAYSLFIGQPPVLSAESFALMVVRTAVSTYIALLVFSLLVGYYLGISKKN